jgi:hypothetical protein
VYLREVTRLPTIRIIALRSLQTDGVSREVESLVFDVVLPPPTDSPGKPIAGKYSVAGWSSNSNGAVAPDVVSLKCGPVWSSVLLNATALLFWEHRFRSIMDPSTIAENAVNLNVNLMRWRVLPELDVDMLTSTKFLLIGAGA